MIFIIKDFWTIVVIFIILYSKLREGSRIDKHLKKAGGYKRCRNNNEDEDNNSKTLNDKNIKFCFQN